MMKIEKR